MKYRTGIQLKLTQGPGNLGFARYFVQAKVCTHKSYLQKRGWTVAD